MRIELSGCSLDKECLQCFCSRLSLRNLPTDDPKTS
jgi:hypothetical protein